MLLKCDTCGIIFERRGNKQKITGARNHYHTDECRFAGTRRGGTSHIRMISDLHEKYGEDVNSMWDVAEYRAAREAAYMKLYGGHPFASKEVKQKIVDTCMERYGVSASVLIPHVKAASNAPEARLKAHATLKRNGSLQKSKPETMMYQWLCQLYGDDDVERWKLVNGWEIDCYVKSTDTCYQMDGVHFHGLDEQFEALKHKYPERYEAIARTKRNDARQNAWFRSAGKSLVRFNEYAFSTSGGFLPYRESIVTMIGGMNDFIASVKRANPWLLDG